MRSLAAALALLVSLAAGAADYEFLPPSPQAGEPFAVVGVLQAGNINGCPVKTMQAQVVGNEILVNEYTGPGHVGPSWSCRLGSLVPGVPAGTYMANLRTSGGFLANVGPLAVTSGSPAAPARRDLSGNWFAREESGWGLNVVQGDSGKLFIAWMMYRPSREPRPQPQNGFTTWPGLGNSLWLVVPDGRWITPNTWRGVAFHSRNVGYLEADDASKRQATPVGYVEIAFTGTDQASFRGRFINELAPEAMVEKTAVLARFAF
jgi:hypothetical protein